MRGLSETLLAEYRELGPELDVRKRYQLAVSTSLPADMQASLSADPEELIRRRLAGNSALVESVQEKLSADTSMAVRCGLALNVSLVESVQENLSSDEDAQVRYNLVNNRSLAPSLHEKISGDTNDDVRCWLAGQVALTLAAQEKLSADPSLPVRRCLAQNPSIVESIQEKLFKDPERSALLVTLAENAALVAHLQALMSYEADPDVLTSLMDNPSLQPTPELGARFLNEYLFGFYDEYAGDADREVLDGLVGGWNQSMTALIEASKLVVR